MKECKKNLVFVLADCKLIKLYDQLSSVCPDLFFSCFQGEGEQKESTRGGKRIQPAMSWTVRNRIRCSDGQPHVTKIILSAKGLVSWLLQFFKVNKC